MLVNVSIRKLLIIIWRIKIRTVTLPRATHVSYKCSKFSQRNWLSIIADYRLKKIHFQFQFFT